MITGQRDLERWLERAVFSRYGAERLHRGMPKDPRHPVDGSVTAAKHVLRTHPVLGLVRMLDAGVWISGVDNIPAHEITARELKTNGTTAERAVGAATMQDDLMRARHFGASWNPEAWIAPTLLNGWSNIAGVGNTFYRKLPWGEVVVRGSVGGGTTANDTVIFNLPAGYRPPSNRQFVGLQGGANGARLNVYTNGDVTLFGVSDNTYLVLESIRFDV